MPLDKFMAENSQDAEIVFNFRLPEIVNHNNDSLL